jgi:hypothetical protein
VEKIRSDQAAEPGKALLLLLRALYLRAGEGEGGTAHTRQAARRDGTRTRVRSPALARFRKAMLEGGQRRVSTCSGRGGAGRAAVPPRPFLLGGALGICTPVPALVSRAAGPWRMHPARRTAPGCCKAGI